MGLRDAAAATRRAPSKEGCLVTLLLNNDTKGSYQGSILVGSPVSYKIRAL